MKGFLEWICEDVGLFVEAAQYIAPEDYEERLQQLGWRIYPSGSHKTAYAPDGIGLVSWSSNNWEKNWHQIARDLLRFAKGGRSSIGGYTDLEFVWQNPFHIPPNFNYKTQELTKTANDPGQKIMVSKLLHNPNTLAGKEIQAGDSWKKVDLADHGNDGMSIEVLFDDGSTVRYNMQQTIMMRQAA